MVFGPYTIDMQRRIPVVVHLSQQDKGHQLAFGLYAQGAAYDASSGTVALNGKKPSGYVISASGTASGNVALFTITEQMTAEFGACVFEVVHFGSDGERKGSANFILDIERDPTDAGVVSDSDLPLLQEAIDAAGDIAGLTTQVNTNKDDIAQLLPLLNGGAGSHNALYRGKYLGGSVTDEQYDAIDTGTFDDLWIGDYWTIGGVSWRIAAFDYYLRTGDTEVTEHHLVIVPDANLYDARMNGTNSTTDGYPNSEMYKTNLAQAKTTINNALGSSHILKKRLYFGNKGNAGYMTAGAWYDSTVELMTEQNVYGGALFDQGVNGTAFAYKHEVDKSQYPLFMFRPDLISNRQTFWLRNVVSAAGFALVAGSGDAYAHNASNSRGVRPAFCICK